MRCYTSEIEGEEYAAYRVLKAQVDEKDVDYLLAEMTRTTDPVKRNRLRGLLGIVEEKHAGMVLEKIKEDERMRDIFWEYFKPQRDAEVNNAVSNTTRTNLFTYVLNGTMTVDNAARNANMTTDQFRQQMEEYNRAHCSQESLQTV